MKKEVTLFLTPGDPDGIGPEVTCKALKRLHKRGTLDTLKKIRVICVGAAEPFAKLRIKTLSVSESELHAAPGSTGAAITLLSAPGAPKPPPQKSHDRATWAGFHAGWSIEKSVRLIQNGAGHGLVTGPIHKGRLNLGGFPYTGHTDFLEALYGVQSGVTMHLANRLLRVSLITTHVALRDVAARVTPEKIRRTVLQTLEHLRGDLGIKKPRIAVAAINPHAGENGLFGKEDAETLAPTLRALQNELGSSVTLAGPLPADTLFALHLRAPARERWDAVVSPYHDQGLVPVKLLDFSRTVNITLGLPFPRVSVDHGVAFDIAGKNRADATSMEEAIVEAARFARARH